MQIDRLFNVLVLGGAALVAGACSGEDPDESGGPLERGAGAGGDAATSGTGGSGGGDAGTGGGDAGGSGSGGNGGAASGSSGQAGAAGTAGVSGLECGGNAGDPCGCPCCWVTDCINDEPCCTEAWGPCGGG